MIYLSERLKPKLFSVLKNYSKEQFIKDTVSGVIVAVIALPLSIALAIASGVKPEQGLYTAIIAGFIISFLGGSRVQIGGPTGAFMIIVYGIVTVYGMNGLIVATVIAGLIMVCMGFLKMGTVIKFIPYTVTAGFTSGIAVVIFSSQIKDFLGLSIEEVPVEFVEKWKTYANSISTIDFSVLATGLLSLTIIIFWPKFTKKIPGALIAMIISAAAVKIFNLDVPTIGSKFQDLSSRLPAVIIPEVDLELIKILIRPAFTIAILGSVESLLSAVVSDGMIGSRHRSNMELIAQGVANIVTPFFGGIPATGAIARTVANIKNGGRTPVAGMIHSVVLLLILVIFMPLAKLIPLSSLAAVLIMVSYNMSEWREFKGLLKAPKSDVAVLLATFFITVFIDLVKAIEIGMVLAAFLFMKRMSDVSNIKITELDAAEDIGEESEFEENQHFENKAGITLYEINGPFFFGASHKFVESMNSLGYKTKVLVIDMRHVPAMDATALQSFKITVKNLNKRKIKLLVSGIEKQPMSLLKKSGLIEVIGQKNIFPNKEIALQEADKV